MICSLAAELSAIVSLMGDTAGSTEIPIKLVLPVFQINMLAFSFKIFAEWLPTALKTYTLAT